MRLQQLLTDIRYALVRSPRSVEETEVTNVVYDSRKVKKGNLFVCLCGVRTDGHAYIEEAYQRGAAVIVIEKMVYEKRMLRLPTDVMVLLVKDTREALADISAAWFHYPSRKLKIIGVTGTKGKTTVTWIIRNLLEQAGHKTGIIGTIETIIGEEHFSALNTTPESFTIQAYFAKMVEVGCEYAVMEVSSQGVKQKRIRGITFEIGVFTNFGEDHIGVDEHADKEEYRHFKALFFRQCRIGIGNLDDEQCQYMLSPVSREIYGYTCQRETRFHSVVQENNKILYANQIEFLIDQKGPVTRVKIEKEEYLLRMPGMFNVYNALAALMTLKVLGIPSCHYKEEIENIQVPGRMERIQTNKGVACYIDYAHNAMSLREVLNTFRAYHPNRIILVFGCGGNRAKSRRTQMGKVAGKLADYTIVTSDNPRYEEPIKIIQDIEEGLKPTQGAYKVIVDRKAAVQYAIKFAKAGDIILIAGKGHETYQEIRGMRYPMDDREFVTLHDNVSKQNK